jgi:uncharacterized membrane protein
MSEVDRQIVQTIIGHGGSVSRFELMSLVDDISDSEIDTAVKRLENKKVVKITQSRQETDPLITVRENALKKVA